MKNPNEYDDEAYTKAVNEFFEAVGKMWDAGAEENDIMSELDTALENARTS